MNLAIVREVTALATSVSANGVESRVKCPIVLVHGLFGFDHIKVGSWKVAEYFRGIPEALTLAGNRVHVARLSPVGTIHKRANQLHEFLKENVGVEPVHLFAHSMGGWTVGI